jgi:hypothetical protein
MTELSPRLAVLGRDLERAAATDLAATRRRRRRRRRGATALAALVLIPGAAVAADRLIGPDDVARSLPAGTLSLAGTEPTCTVERADVQFHCTLAHAPAPEVSDWKGTVEPTVDSTQHVNGGCRSLRSDGREWRCYLGQEAVRQQIIGAGFLGERVSGPGQG